MSTLLSTVMENLLFVLEFLGLAAAMTAIAWASERLEKKRSGRKERTLTTRKIAFIGVFSAIAAMLHILDFAVPFAPPFYKMDFSELPALIGAFAFGPVAAVLIELCKIVLKLLFKGTSTAFVGDLANFIIGCSFLLPASIPYLFRKTKRSALAGCVAGTAVLTLFGTLFNAVYLLPKFAQLYGMPLESIIDMGHAINPAINNVTTLVAFAVAPMNLMKGGLVSLITMLVYKKLSPILHSSRS